MKATCAKKLGKHKVLETFWKATWTQHERNMHKNRKNIRFLKRFGKQHGHNMKATCTKTWENTRFLKRFGKQHGHNMKATCTKNREKPGKTWTGNILKRFGKQHAWTQHENMQHAQKPGKTPGS